MTVNPQKRTSIDCEGGKNNTDGRISPSDPPNSFVNISMGVATLAMAVATAVTAVAMVAMTVLITAHHFRLCR